MSAALQRDPEPRSAPERTCVGCRQQDHKHALLRFAVRDVDPSAPKGGDPHGRLVPDVRARLGGRGVSVHPTRACLERAVKKGGFAKALRAKVDLDLDRICELAASQYLRRVEGLLVAGVRSRRVAVGTDAVRDALRDGELLVLVVASDAAGRRDELMAGAERLGRRCVVVGDKAWLGRLAGRGEVGVLGLLDGGIADEVMAMTERAMELGMPGVEMVSATASAEGTTLAKAGRKE